MSTLRRVLNHPYAFWALLALPALPMIWSLATSTDPRLIHRLVHPTGEFAARYTIFAMMVTPLTMLLPGWRGPLWLLRRRRYLGVGAFLFALAHTVFYLIDKGAIAATAGELAKTWIWTGWLAFLIFVPLAITSTNGWVRAMGRNWKSVQRLVYPAALLTLVHWASLHNWGGIAPAAVHFAPLALLEMYRIASNLGWMRPAAA